MINNNNVLMFFKNEILEDIKKVEIKLDNKILKILESLEEQKTLYEKKMNNFENTFKILKGKIQNLNNNNLNDKDINEKIIKLNKKTEDYFSKLDSRFILFQTSFQDSCYKYDKTILNNSQIPGLIGERCPYSSMRDFYENIHRKLNEFLRHKDQQSIDLKKYKEKMNDIITQNKTYLPMFENKITNYFDTQIKDIDNKYKERVDIIEERINNLRIENGKYSSELIEKCNNLNDRWSKIDDIIKDLLYKYNEEINNFKVSFKEIRNNLNNFEDKYNKFLEKIKMLKEINNYLTIKNKNNKILKENKNKIINDDTKNINLDSNIDYKLQSEEMELNSLINSKQNKEIEESRNKQNLKESNIKIELSKRNHKQNYRELNHYNRKKENLFDESYEYTKINNIVFDADFFRRSYYFGNSSINNYYNQNYRLKKTKNIFNRIKSGKLSYHFPFITNDINDGQINDIISRNQVNNYKQRNSTQEKYDIKDIYKNENLKDEYDIKNEFFILRNLHKSQDAIKKEFALDLSDIYFSPGNKYLYLDKKIDILSNVMVESLNKLIFQINNLKKNYHNNSDNQSKSNYKKKELLSFKNKSLIKSLSNKKIFNSSVAKERKNFTTVNIDNKRK